MISPDVNHHDGQGTSSITVEFTNAYLELIYPDPAVAVSDGLRSVAQIFRDRSNWRVTGYCPTTLQFRRTPMTPAEFPFPTSKVRADWMAPGQYIELLTPRGMPKALSLAITPTPVDEAENAKLAVDPMKEKRFEHPNGARRLTGVEAIVPTAADLPPAAAYVADAQAAKSSVGGKWLVILTLDGSRQGKSQDFVPTLPLIVRY